MRLQEILRKQKGCPLQLGYPVALKVSSSDILHKTEREGVRLNLNLMYRSKRHSRAWILEAYMVQKMAQSGFELIVGGKWDPLWPGCHHRYGRYLHRII